MAETRQRFVPMRLGRFSRMRVITLFQIHVLYHLVHQVPITVAARSNAGIVGSILTQGMDICMRLFSLCVVLCLGVQVAALRRADPPSKESCRVQD
jgi:hypothetical protein